MKLYLKFSILILGPIFTLLSSCSSVSLKSRAPAANELDSCAIRFSNILNSGSTYSLKRIGIIEKLSAGLIDRRQSTKIYIDRYEATAKRLNSIPLAELDATKIDFGVELEFEDILAYWDSLIAKAYRHSEQGLEPIPGVKIILDSQNDKAKKVLFDLKRKFDKEKTLTQSEIQSMLMRFSTLMLEHSASSTSQEAMAFKRLALKSFLLKLSTTSLTELFARESYKNPVAYQRFLDRLSRIMKSRVVTIARNVILPGIQISQGVIPLPLKPIDFILDDEIVEKILRDGFPRTWPEIQRRYSTIGINTLRFNRAVRLYRPVGLIGFLFTSYILYQSQAQDAIDEQSEKSEEMILNSIRESEKMVSEIAEAVNDPLMEVMVAEFESTNGRVPTALELEELRQLFSQ